MNKSARYTVQVTAQHRDGRWENLPPVSIAKLDEWKSIAKSNAPTYRYQSIEVVDAAGDVVHYQEIGHAALKG